MKCLFRLDANTNIGYGHYQRCLTLSEFLLKVSVDSYFFLNGDFKVPDSLKAKGGYHLSRYIARTSNINCELSIEDQYSHAEEVLHKLYGIDFLIVDHYGLGQPFINVVKENFPRLLVVLFDDFIRDLNLVDMIINPVANKKAYSQVKSQRCYYCVGNKFSVVSSCFLERRNESYNSKKLVWPIENCLVCFGGTDPNNLTEKFLSTEFYKYFKTVHIIMGGLSVNISSVRRRVADLPNVKLLIDGDMVEEMNWAHIMMGAPGSMSWERSVMSLPSFTWTFSDNQVETARYFSKNRATHLIGDSRDLEVEFPLEKFVSIKEGDFKEMVDANNSLCDGLGGYRVALSIIIIHSGSTLRAVHDEDVDKVFSWQTETDIRHYFNTPMPPTWQEHCKWFYDLTEWERKHFYIIKVGKHDCGFVRLTKESGDNYVSILVSQHAQGISLAEMTLKKLLQVESEPLLAKIDPRNVASVKAFLSAGFSRDERGVYYAEPE